MPSLRIALAGEEAAGARALRLMLESGHEVTGVYTSGLRSHSAREGIADLARQHAVPVSRAEDMRGAASAALSAAGVDILVNVHSLYIVHESVLDALRIGAFNLHPGPLPEYAGLNTVSWALYENADTYGATLHWMEPRVDAGPIAYRSTFDVEPSDSALSLMSRSVAEGLRLLQVLLRQLEDDPAGVPRQEQDLSRRHYYRGAVPRGGRIDWTESAARVVGLVRACDYGPFPSPWGRAALTVKGRRVEVLRARRTGEPSSADPGIVERITTRGAKIAAADESVLIERLAIGGEDIAATEVLAEGSAL